MEQILPSDFISNALIQIAKGVRAANAEAPKIGELRCTFYC